MLVLPTPHGSARVHLHPAEDAAIALILGHGAGGGVNSPDLLATTNAARALGVSVALVEQPYRVAGRRSPAPARQLDSAWLAVIAQLREDALDGLSIITGGRSAGARVACRTASASSATAVLCLAFPVHPPGRADDPSKSRLPELDAVKLPTLVVQGENDPFGMPPGARNRTVVRVPGDHSLRSGAVVSAAVSDWLSELIAALTAKPRRAARRSSSPRKPVRAREPTSRSGL